MTCPSRSALRSLRSVCRYEHVPLLREERVPKGRKIGHITKTANLDAERRAYLRQLLQRLPGSSASEVDLYAFEALQPGSEASQKQPLIGVIMGSDLDLPVI